LPSRGIDAPPVDGRFWPCIGPPRRVGLCLVSSTPLPITSDHMTPVMGASPGLLDRHHPTRLAGVVPHVSVPTHRVYAHTRRCLHRVCVHLQVGACRTMWGHVGCCVDTQCRIPGKAKWERGRARNTSARARAKYICIRSLLKIFRGAMASQATRSATQPG